MASAAELAVTKASLSATLFRADPISCSRDDIDHFFALLNSAVAQCSPANVQKCKQWILANVLPSSSRVAPLGKYLCALVNSIASEKDAERSKPKLKEQPHEPSARRKRLHVLYILNDIFYHVKFRDGNTTFADKFDAFLPALVRSAAAFPGCPKHAKKIQSLISLWEEKGYFSSSTIAKLRTSSEQALVAEQTNAADRSGAQDAAKATATSKEVPFVMPAMHGDPTMPWYDLPAGNWLPVLEPNSTRPMNPSMIRPLQLAPGPAEKTLVEAVSKLLADVDRLYSSEARDEPYDVNQMGEMVEKNDLKGAAGHGGGDTYYGWSRAFAEKMKARRRKARMGGGDTDKSRHSSRSYSKSPTRRSRSRSRGPRGLRSSQSQSRSSSRPGFGRRRPSSDSRSPSRRMRGLTHSRSRSRSRSTTDYRRRRMSTSRSRSPMRSSPDYSPPAPQQRPSNDHSMGMQRLKDDGEQVFYSQPAPFLQHPPQHTPYTPVPYPTYGGYPTQPPPPFPVPPPPPQGYNGQWPPPPPPPPPGMFPPGGPPHPGALPIPTWSGAWPPLPPQQQQQYQQAPPPPPPPPQHQPRGQYGYGRGNSGPGGFHGRGRGGWTGGL